MGLNSEGMQLAAEEAMSTPEAGTLLAEAWRAAFGMHPDPTTAYSSSIKAVEAAAAPVVSPKDTMATLGKILVQMRNQSKGDQPWGLPLAGKSPQVPIEMIETLWTGQKDRYGGSDRRPPTQEEAEVAVLLAVPLVQWFTSGAIARWQA